MKRAITIPVITIVILSFAIILGFGLVSEQKPEPEIYDDVLISLERTECSGGCPVYSVTIFEDGTVIYEGKKHVENIGTYQYSILKKDVDRLIDKFRETNFFAMKERYERDVIDHSTTITKFMSDSYKKTVSNYADAGPKRLHDLEQTIDNIARVNTMNTHKVPSRDTVQASVYDMKPNSMEYFYYPNPKQTENRDVFQKFILIRLPVSMGGLANDTLAFRAYSAVSLTDHCMVKYWPHEGRQRMENPCRGDIYRATDGLLIAGVDPIKITSPMSLPHLDLSIDKNGVLYVEPPTWTLQKNGVIGIGREMTLEQIRHNSASLSDLFAKGNPHHPKIPLEFAGYILSDISSRNRGIEVRYLDFTSMFGGITMSIQHTSSEDQRYFLNFATPNSEFWQVGNNIIRITGSALDPNNEQPEQLKEYVVDFLHDSFKITIKGKNIEFMKKEIIKNYFSEYSYEELFLISKN